jgi:hypothetical protein
VKLVIASAVLLVTGGEAPMNEGDRASSVELALVGHSSRSAVALGVPAAPGQVQVQDAHLSLRDVRLREASRCDRPGGALVAAGPIIAELVSGRAAGVDAAKVMAPGTYCRLEYAPRRAEGRSGGAPAELRGHTVMVRGRRHDGVRFIIRSQRRELVQLLARKAGGFSIGPGRTRLVLSADLGRWLEGIDLEALIPGRGKNGIIRIDESSHRELLRIFEGNLVAGLTLCRGDDDATRSSRECPSDRRLAGAAR